MTDTAAADHELARQFLALAKQARMTRAVEQQRAIAAQASTWLYRSPRHTEIAMLLARITVQAQQARTCPPIEGDLLSIVEIGQAAWAGPPSEDDLDEVPTDKDEEDLLCDEYDRLYSLLEDAESDAELLAAAETLEQWLLASPVHTAIGLQMIQIDVDCETVAEESNLDDIFGPDVDKDQGSGAPLSARGTSSANLSFATEDATRSTEIQSQRTGPHGGPRRIDR